ncbi:hypothetical protein CAOG_07503 [Capsaspora owczarzaki ATCC 30864]|uniref:Uncharacterized protein n=1 Tax=Capsaspora owczarzaki (strain ATCC 30864) TaxID=595528 RepID=A0A0D2UPU0_CAPO3|nr:hypothetical protein CAOG_07503 [Capsaspora owczarzaki ATCC 30864]KJE97016.1 hypothetical protein CAOG_007503 [Capsaspora owczarzaki ATCC 30864]|eukprot:XP_004343377.1 hypothetical protein CAOG_07503 [Capsaspora owczarzaki ATCC 30864]
MWSLVFTAALLLAAAGRGSADTCVATAGFNARMSSPISFYNVALTTCADSVDPCPAGYTSCVYKAHSPHGIEQYTLYCTHCVNITNPCCEGSERRPSDEYSGLCPLCAPVLEYCPEFVENGRMDGTTLICDAGYQCNGENTNGSNSCMYVQCRPNGTINRSCVPRR